MALWGGIAGFLKARTGAHEVIVTIMLNYVAFYLVSWMLRTPGLLQAPGSSNPKTPPMKDTAIFPELLGPQYNLHFGFILVIGATVLVWWILSRSSLGFQFRAVGENPNAARVAGINVNSMYIIGMLIAGGLVGLAGVNQVLGTITTGLHRRTSTPASASMRSPSRCSAGRPRGAPSRRAVLFGAFKAGGFSMQAAEQIPIDIVTVVQALIVLFIAAPPLVRTIFFLPSPERDERRRAKAREKQIKAAAATAADARGGGEVTATLVQPAAAETGTEIAVIRSWKVPIALTVFTVLLGLLLLLAPRDGVTTFRISGGNDPVQVPEIAAAVARRDLERLRHPRAADCAVGVPGAHPRQDLAVARRRLHLHLRRRVPDVGGGRRHDSGHRPAGRVARPRRSRSSTARCAA